MIMKSKTYIGDSVYASYDGLRITLTTENGYPDDPRNKIVLEQEVWQALQTFMKLEKKKNEVQTENDKQWPDSQADWT